MPEILFIANDPDILALIESLQPLIALKVGVELDYSSGVKRIFNDHPSVVFLQSKIDDVSCETAANQVKMLLDNDDIRLVLLSDSGAASDSLAAAFDSCLDLNLPFDELSRQIRQLLSTLPSVAWSTSTATQPPVFQSKIMEFEPQDRLESFGLVPAANDDGWSGELTAASDVHVKALEALQSNEPLDAEVLGSAEGFDPHFLDFFLGNQVESESLEGELASASLQKQPGPPAPSSTSAASEPLAPLLDFYQIEGESPYQQLADLAGAPDEPGLDPYPDQTLAGLAGAPDEPGPDPCPDQTLAGLAGAPDEPGLDPPEAWEPQLSDEVTLPAAGSHETIQERVAVEATASISPDQETGHPQAAETEDPIVDAGSDAVPLAIGPKATNAGPNRGIISSLLLALCIVSIAALIWYNGTNDSDVSKGLGITAPLPAPSTEQELPQFIPRVAPDAKYGESHPGWTSYHSDALQYLVYREKSRIRAIQVLSEEYGAITVPFLKTCIRIVSGDELSNIKTTETRKDFLIVTGALQNGGEVVIYRSIADGEIRGFVLTFPATPSLP